VFLYNNKKNRPEEYAMINFKVNRYI